MTVRDSPEPPRLVWLASYPKSGNTWLRALLAAYLFGSERDHDSAGRGGEDTDELDLAGLGMHYASRSLFDTSLGIPSVYLTETEIDQLRPSVWRWINSRAHRTRFVKTHDAWRRNAQLDAIFPADATVATIVIVRNPLAIVPSWAHHSGITIDAAIDALADRDAGLSRSTARISDQLPQVMGRWDDHVSSWLDQRDLSVTLLRYEDLSSDGIAGLSTVLGAVGLEPEPERVKAAVDACRFDRLAAREAQSGFAERSGRDRTFFRRGEADSWRHELTGAQITRIVGTHAATMERLGYETSQS